MGPDLPEHMRAASPAYSATTSPRLAYASFDRFPSPKGAATHIESFVSALSRHYGQLDLFTVAPIPEETTVCAAPSHHVNHFPLLAEGAHLFERVEHFRVQMWRRLIESVDRGGQFDVFHFRSIFEGYPVAKNKSTFCKQLIYEVNGLPSIELKYHYPQVAEDQELLKKIRHQEQVCLQAADRIVTVSEVNARHLFSLGVPNERVTVIRNGADLSVFETTGKPPAFGAAEPIRLLYCGGLTAWQGVAHAVEALALINRDRPAVLTVVGPARPRQRKWLDNLAYDLGVYDRLTRLPPVSRQALAKLHHESQIVLAPLTKNDRNTKQGCCPLKVLEAMASGVPLIASDLEVVRELVDSEREAILVRPGSGKAIKDAVFRLIHEQGLAASLATAARRRIEAGGGWLAAQQQLLGVYDDALRRGQA